MHDRFAQIIDQMVTEQGSSDYSSALLTEYGRMQQAYQTQKEHFIAKAQECDQLRDQVTVQVGENDRLKKEVESLKRELQDFATSFDGMNAYFNGVLIKELEKKAAPKPKFMPKLATPKFLLPNPVFFKLPT